MIVSLPERHAALEGRVSMRELATWRWLTAPVMATRAAVERLTWWLDDGRPGVGPLHFVGDATLGAAARAVLGRLPPPMAWFVSSHCLVMGVGKETAGWFSWLPALPPAPREHPKLVAISGNYEGDALPSLIAHELGHTWLGAVGDRELAAADLPTEMEVAPAVWAQQSGAAQVARARDEYATVALARSLGFVVGPAVDLVRYSAVLRAAKEKCQ